MLALHSRTLDEGCLPERLEWMVAEELSPDLVLNILDLEGLYLFALR